MNTSGTFRVLFLHDSLVVNARSAEQIHGSILYEEFKMYLLKLTANSLYSVFWPKTFVSILFTYFKLKVSFLQPLTDVYFVTVHISTFSKNFIISVLFENKSIYFKTCTY
jgi:hypothetical protein